MRKVVDVSGCAVSHTLEHCHHAGGSATFSKVALQIDTIPMFFHIELGNLHSKSIQKLTNSNLNLLVVGYALGKFNKF